ncbi:MAG TPA: glycosyltransferase family 2 protein [Anaeromyxobacter sp.]|nr:glycosyltransferase family 2 protein [Anaeromyxobacter sp.]
MPSSGRVPRISVVTPSYNAALTVERTLRSIEAQGYPELQVICIDGGSSDGTQALIEQHSDLVSVFVSEKDRGVASALNKGFRRADGDIFCWLNADDEFAPGALHRVAEAFRSRSEADVVTGGCRRFFPDGSTVTTEVPDRFLAAMALRNDIEQPSTFWRAAAHRRSGELDESYRLSFDWEWWNRLLRTGARFLRVPEVLSHYHFSDANLTSRGAQEVVEEMCRVTATYASSRVAKVYRFLYRAFDLRGFYDPPIRDLPPARRLVFRTVLSVLRRRYGTEVIDNYNWNWASKQVRGLVWYR